MAEASPAPTAAAPGSIEGTQRVAALLLAMGKPLADRVLKYFSDTEMRHVVETTVNLGAVPRLAIDKLVDEVAAAIDLGADIRGGTNDAEQLLSGLVPPEHLASIMSSVRHDGQHSVWQRLTEMPEPTVSQFLAKEHPQVAALALSKAGSATAAAVLCQMPGSARTEVVRRVLAIRPVTEIAQALLEQGIQDELLVKVSKETGPPVHVRVADIINKMERQQMDEVLSDLEKRRPKDAKLVKGLLFTFDDIARLAPADRVKLFDGVPAERTILALQGASATMRELVLSSVSSRSRRMIEQEIASAANTPPREVMKARRFIADLALELAERGQIEIAQQDGPVE